MATRYRVTAPVPHVVSTIAGVAFNESVGETDNPGAVAYFRRHGYQLDELVDRAAAIDETTPASDPPPPPSALTRPAKSASKVDWVSYAVAQGVDAAEAEALTRDALAERFADTPTGGTE